MGHWPRSAVTTVSMLAVTFAITLYVTYIETRASYRAVGFNDGQIYQREMTWNRIRDTVPLSTCELEESKGKSVELIAVKSQSLYIKVSPDGSTHFCQKL